MTEMNISESNVAVSAEPKMMGFVEAIKTCFKKYFSFHGCASRAEYWWFYLFTTSVSMLCVIPAIVAASNHNFNTYLVFMIFETVFVLATFLPSISVSVRRMHDTGNQGFFSIIPIANFVLTLLPSVKNNEYRSGDNVHPTANVLGKIFVIFSQIILLCYMGAMLTTVYFLSDLDLSSLSESGYESSDDEDYSRWWEDEEVDENTEDSSETVYK